MRDLMKPLLIALTFTGAPVMAQETEDADAATTQTGTADTGTTETNAAGSDATPEDLNFGTPIQPSEPITSDELAQLQPGQPYVLQVFSDWKLRCIKAPEGQSDPCQLYQLLFDNDGNAVAEVSLFPLPEGSRAAAGATIVAPLETLLTQQLTLSVDGANARRYPFTFCNPAGCVARIGFTTDEIDQFKRGSEARLRMVPAAAPDQEVILTMSLNGFTAGFDGVVQVPE